MALNFKKLISWSLVKQGVDPSDLAPDEKAEAKQLIEAYVDIVYGSKFGDPAATADLQKTQAEIMAAAGDGKVEAKEVRPVFIRMKTFVKKEGRSFPSSLFTITSWNVRIVGFDSARRKEAREAVAKALGSGGEEGANFILSRLPQDVVSGVPEVEANRIMKALMEAGCDVVILPAEAEAPHK
jgi:hypothetical protein